MSQTGIRLFFRISAWLLLAAIAVLSFVPSNLRPITPAPHAIEHAGIYFLTGVVFAIAYSRSTILNIAILVCFGVLIEVAQLAVPGRHARLTDLVENFVGILVGVVVVVIVKMTVGRRWPL